jgi:hypothetical protein
VDAAAKMVITDPGGTRTLTAPTFNVYGRLVWLAGSVYLTPPDDLAPTRINISPTGVFEIKAAGETLGLGNSNPSHLLIDNDGLTKLSSTNGVTIRGNYESSGTTELFTGLLGITGTAEQTGGWFKLLNGTTIETNVLGIRDGYLVGHGTVLGNLVLGYAPGSGVSTPTISPGGGPPEASAIGTITVTSNFHMYNGVMSIDIAGQNSYDKIVVVNGYASFETTDPNSTRQLVGQLLPVHEAINPNTVFPFLTYNQLISDFGAPAPNPPITDPGVGWTHDKNNSQYWFKSPDVLIPPSQEESFGSGGGGGAFGAGVENPTGGVAVHLLDATGTNVLVTTPDANGLYEFDDLDPGGSDGEGFTVPDAAETVTLKGAGSDDSVDSDADGAGYPDAFTATSGNTFDIDVGIYPIPGGGES